MLRSVLNPWPHFTDALISDEHRFIYFHNRKAGSSAILHYLRRYANATDVPRNASAATTWHGRTVVPCPDAYVRRACCWWPMFRSTSKCLSREHHDGYFRFSFVRDPIAKFESGVRQAWLNNDRLRNFSADQLLNQVLTNFRRRPPLKRHCRPEACRLWVDEHLAPSRFHTRTWAPTQDLKRTRTLLPCALHSSLSLTSPGFEAHGGKLVLEWLDC